MSVLRKDMQSLQLNQKARLPETAMVLCAGLGTRMRPLTDDRPKALVEVAGKPLLARTLKRCKAAGINRVVVNAHYQADVLEEFVGGWKGKPRLEVSDERDTLLDTGGGIQNALPIIGDKRFFVINCDVLWRNGPNDTLRHLARHWDGKKMDALLLLVPMTNAKGVGDKGDFTLTPSGQIRWPKERRVASFGFAGIQMLHPRAFEGRALKPYSVREIWNEAMEKDRIYGCVHEGLWCHVGTPSAIAPTEAMLGA
ncbi:MAG: nucleotidyltransferase family protein [Pseudomonadota bacterium]